MSMADDLEAYVKPEIPKPMKFANFLEHLMDCGNVADAARQADLTIQQVRLFRRNNPKAQAAFEEALDIGTDAIEAELHRRAISGTLEPVFYKGRRVNTIRKKSDVLLMFLLKSRRPHIYRDNAPLTPPDQDDDNLGLESPAEEIARRLNQLADRKRETSNPPVIDSKPTRPSKK